MRCYPRGASTARGTRPLGAYFQMTARLAKYCDGGGASARSGFCDLSLGVFVTIESGTVASVNRLDGPMSLGLTE